MSLKKEVAESLISRQTRREGSGGEKKGSTRNIFGVLLYNRDISKFLNRPVIGEDG